MMLFNEGSLCSKVYLHSVTQLDLRYSVYIRTINCIHGESISSYDIDKSILNPKTLEVVEMTPKLEITSGSNVNFHTQLLPI